MLHQIHLEPFVLSTEECLGEQSFSDVTGPLMAHRSSDDTGPLMTGSLMTGSLMKDSLMAGSLMTQVCLIQEIMLCST